MVVASHSGLPPEWKVSWVADDAVVAKSDSALDLTMVPKGATPISLASRKGSLTADQF